MKANEGPLVRVNRLRPLRIMFNNNDVVNVDYNDFVVNNESDGNQDIVPGLCGTLEKKL